MNNLLNVLSMIGGLFAIIVSMRKGYLFFKKWKQERRERRARYFAGNWNNQSQIILPPPHYVDLDAFGYGKRVEGRFNVRQLNDVNSWEMFELEGTCSGKKALCKLFKIVGTAKVLVAIGVLKRDDYGMLWTLKESYADHLPVQAVLQRGFPKVI